MTSPKLLDQVRSEIRAKHNSYRTETNLRSLDDPVYSLPRYPSSKVSPGILPGLFTFNPFGIGSEVSDTVMPFFATRQDSRGEAEAAWRADPKGSLRDHRGPPLPQP